MEFCGGIATGLEAILKAGHAVASYMWADIDSDAHTATTNNDSPGYTAGTPTYFPRRLRKVGTPAYPWMIELSPRRAIRICLPKVGRPHHDQPPQCYANTCHGHTGDKGNQPMPMSVR